MGEMRNVYTDLVRKPEWERHMRNLGVDGKIKLTCVVKEEDVSVHWSQLAQVRAK
jgi:hypothetical protein